MFHKHFSPVIEHIFRKSKHPIDSSAHSQALNSNLKAYAAWWLWVSISKTINDEPLPTSTSTTDPTTTSTDSTTSDPTSETTNPSDDPDPGTIAGFGMGGLLFTSMTVLGAIIHKSKKKHNMSYIVMKPDGTL